MAITPITVKTQIPTGYMSRVQITARFKISESSLSNYQRDYPEFPNCFRQYISGINREIGTFKTVELVEWFETKRNNGANKKMIEKGLDLALIKVFFKHLDKRHFTQRLNSV